MKFALVNGTRQEAQPGLSGACVGCGQTMIAKCGEVRVWHWGHKGRLLCDPWWENETEWHRAWKDQFPTDWQEFVHRAEDGERHIADVKTPDGWVIEFQHSHLDPEERRSRDAFYPNLVWVVDATRRKRDEKQIAKAFSSAVRLFAKPPILRVRTAECAFFLEWADSPSPVFFDFGSERPLLWFIVGRADGPAYVALVPRTNFVEMHRRATQTTRTFDEPVKEYRGLVAE
jgi:hypothetical protein